MQRIQYALIFFLGILVMRMGNEMGNISTDERGSLAIRGDA